MEAQIECETLFLSIGGEKKVKQLANRFYDLLESEPQYAQARATHKHHLDDVRLLLFWFLCGWLGGPQHYVKHYGDPRLRTRHLHIQIGIVERDQWLACMNQAMIDVRIPDDIQTQLKLKFFQLADVIRNKKE